MPRAITTTGRYHVTIVIIRTQNGGVTREIRRRGPPRSGRSHFGSLRPGIGTRPRNDCFVVATDSIETRTCRVAVFWISESHDTIESVGGDCRCLVGMEYCSGRLFRHESCVGIRDYTTPQLFETAVLVATLSSGVVATLCLAFLRDNPSRQQAAVRRMGETERLSRALRILSTMDQSMKMSLEESERAGDGGVSREQFRAMLLQEEDTVSLDDADAFFNMFDRIEDGNLTAKDFHQSTPPSRLSWG